MRMTHDEVVAFCHATVMVAPGGFPLALANESANLIYQDVIGRLEAMIVELRRLQAEQSIPDPNKNGKKR